MCGRFTQTHTWAEIAELYKLMDESAPSVFTSWNVAPTHNAGVIVMSAEGPCFRPMRWGLVPFWAKDPSIGSTLINARSETLAEKPAFQDALKSRRCVVPVSGFYEWQRLGKSKRPFFIASADNEPLALAGLWERWNDLLTFTIITVPANEKLSLVHNRMPAILSREDAHAWLSTGDTALLRPCAHESLALWPVSTRVNAPANNDARLIEAVSQADESSNENQSRDNKDQFAFAL